MIEYSKLQIGCMLIVIYIAFIWMNGILKIGGLSTGLRHKNLLIIWSSISYVTPDCQIDNGILGYRTTCAMKNMDRRKRNEKVI